jgi:hypothetical protein
VKPLFAVAQNFHCSGSWKDRLQVAEGSGWRAPNDDELASLTQTPGRDPACCCLFSVPAHISHRFWAMLNEEAAEGAGNFDEFSQDLAGFLTFKELPPPENSVSELLIQNPDGQVDTGDIWALVNFGEEPVFLAWPQTQLRLGPAEGCRLAAGFPPAVLPPAEDELNVLLAIRLGSA